MRKPGFIAGVKYFFRGVELIRQPRFRKFVLIPASISALLFSLAIWLTASSVYEWVEGLQVTATTNSEEAASMLDSIIAWVSWILIPISVLIVMAVMFYTFTLLANLVAAPFNSLLSEKIEGHLGGEMQTGDGNIMDMIKDAGGSFASELRKLGYFVLRALPFAVLFPLGFFLPPIGFVVSIAWFLFSAWMLAIEYSDYPMGNHALRFPDQRRTLKENKMFALGFGSAVFAATMIPIVNFFAMPIAIAASTAMWVDYWKENIPQIEYQ